MTNPRHRKPMPTNIGTVRRKGVSISEDRLVKIEPLVNGESLVVMQPDSHAIKLIEWAAHNSELIEKHLLKHGAILLRDFNVDSPAEFERIVQSVGGELLEYGERSSPRSQVHGNVYTSTDYPADQSIFVHNENSYQQTWPMRLFFFCLTPADQGGETPIADCRKVYERIDDELKERFIRKKVLYVRNFMHGLGLTWQKVFQTDDQSRVEEYCRRNAIEYEWKGGDRLRIQFVRPPVERHPKTGEMVWFNHATFFHVSTLEPAIRQELTAQLKESDLPSNTYYGDGSLIEPETMDQLRAAYRCETSRCPWQKGDILVLDNMLTAHGRTPYEGPRRILVGMTQPHSR